ncbi:MAG: hypothetical protein SH848_16815 [Saprospiraceae bacterium]|nr:hypothetical protein [Saprospiraceae bacterium]MDZ4705590.1 hypothetical protein [Saprospiraceae bacterium]
MNFKNLFSKITLIFISILAFACSKDIYPKIEEMQEQNIQEIISPNGVWISESIGALKEAIKPSVIQLFKSRADFHIINFNFLEADNQTAMFIEISNDEGKSSKVIFVKEVSFFRDAPDKCYTISCNGECSCTPSGTIHNGSVTFQCNGGCPCSMTVREFDCQPSPPPGGNN